MLKDYILTIPAILIAIVFHEYAHGYVAYRLGDSTAKDAGRLTLNPIKHLDPVGLLSMIFLKFGWAKGVPVDARYFKNPKKGMLLTSLAGPAANFILAIVAAIIFKIVLMFIPKNDFIMEFLFLILWYNIMLGVFNLIPLPPLDGSKIAISFFSDKWNYYFYKYENYLYIITLLFIVSDFSNKLIGPIVKGILNIFLYFIFKG